MFGKANVVIAMVPNGSVVKERELTKKLGEQEFIDYALSMAGTLPQGIPESFLPGNVTKQPEDRQVCQNSHIHENRGGE